MLPRSIIVERKIMYSGLMMFLKLQTESADMKTGERVFIECHCGE